MVECFTLDQGAAHLNLTGVTALCPLARHIYPSLVIVQPRKTRPYITERLLMGRKESNHTNKFQTIWNNSSTQIRMGNSIESTVNVTKGYVRKNSSNLCYSKGNPG